MFLFLDIGKALLIGKTIEDVSSLTLLAASVGERLLKIPRFEDDKPQFFESLRSIRNACTDDFEFTLNCLRHDVGEHIISRPAKRHSLRVAKSLTSQLKVQDRADGDDFLARLLWASAMYPNVAIKAPRRNEYLLKSRSLAEIPKESMLYRESIETVIEEGFRAPNSVPKCIVFEELFDAGFRMIIKSTAIDPLLSVLFARSVTFSQDSLVLDNFFCVRGDKETLNLLVQFRECWRVGSKAIFSPKVDKDLRWSFKELLLSFSRQLNISRPTAYELSK